MIAIVILNWNGEKYLRKFLPSVIEHSEGARVIVADNGSTDSSLEVLRNEFPKVEVITLDRNYGFAEGYNRALSQISSKYYVLLNSDVEVTADWLTPMVTAIESDEKIAAIQPKILSYDNKKLFEHAGASGGFIDSLGFPFCRGRIMGSCEVDSGQYDDRREIFWASGAALFIRSEVYHRAGGLDSLFFAHMEEIDLCWRVKRLGYKVIVEPQSTVYHVGGGTLPVSSPRKTYLNFRNNIAMVYKNLKGYQFTALYFVRFFSDSLQAFAYLVCGKFSFFRAVVRGHYDFWCTRKRYKIDSSIPKGRVGEIYRSSIILRSILISKKFKNLL